MSGGVFTMKIKNKTYVFLTAVVFLAVWCFAGRNGLFASWGDWSSQHSVIPAVLRYGAVLPGICSRTGRRTKYLSFFLLWAV